jgi:hypothetical protein
MRLKHAIQRVTLVTMTMKRRIVWHRNYVFRQSISNLKSVRKNELMAPREEDRESKPAGWWRTISLLPDRCIYKSARPL